MKRIEFSEPISVSGTNAKFSPLGKYLAFVYANKVKLSKISEYARSEVSRQNKTSIFRPRIKSYPDFYAKLIFALSSALR
jgi:hypothetical protein